MVLSRKFLLERGYCCKLGCVCCPYMKISYVIKTGNDLTFEFDFNEKILKCKNHNAEEILIQELENEEPPYCITIDDVEYYVISFIKVKVYE